MTTRYQDNKTNPLEDGEESEGCKVWNACREILIKEAERCTHPEKRMDLRDHPKLKAFIDSVRKTYSSTERLYFYMEMATDMREQYEEGEMSKQRMLDTVHNLKTLFINGDQNIRTFGPLLLLV